MSNMYIIYNMYMPRFHVCSLIFGTYTYTILHTYNIMHAYMYVCIYMYLSYMYIYIYMSTCIYNYVNVPCSSTRKSTIRGNGPTCATSTCFAFQANGIEYTEQLPHCLAAMWSFFNCRFPRNDKQRGGGGVRLGGFNITPCVFEQFPTIPREARRHLLEYVRRPGGWTGVPQPPLLYI